MKQTKSDLSEMKAILDQSAKIKSEVNELDIKCKLFEEKGKDSIIKSEIKTRVINQLKPIVIPKSLYPLLRRFNKKIAKVDEYYEFRIDVRDTSEKKYRSYYAQPTEKPKAELTFNLDIELDKEDTWSVDILENSVCKQDYGFNLDHCITDINDNYEFLVKLLTDREKFEKTLEETYQRVQKEK